MMSSQDYRPITIHLFKSSEYSGEPYPDRVNNQSTASLINIDEAGFVFCFKNKGPKEGKVTK
jgi:hypothetical protein